MIKECVLKEFRMVEVTSMSCVSCISERETRLYSLSSVRTITSFQRTSR